MITEPPTVHRLITTRPGLTQDGSVVHAGPSMPTTPSIWLIRPLCPLKSSSSRIPIATGGVIFGRKNAVRKKPEARPAQLSSSARNSETSSCAGTDRAAKMNVFFSASATLGSSRSVWKFSRPTNVGALITS
jgi:hypothetical protein